MRRRSVVLLLGVLVWLVPVAPVAAAEWGWPLGGEVPALGRAFDPPEVRYAAGHRGVDLVAAPGAPVLAAGAGRVSYAGLLAGRGVVVVVHGALRTTYEPVTASVAVGDAVGLGQVLGTLEAGHLGCPARACLHWGLRRGEQYLDPLSLVARGPAVLLPVPRGGGAAAGADLPPVSGLAAPHPDGDLARFPAAEPVEAVPAVPGPSVLRAVTSPLGGAALVALVAGLGLLARSGRPPTRRPPAEAALAVPPGPAVPVPVAEPPPRHDPVDLAAERSRRRA